MRKKDTGVIYALKVLGKSQVKKRKQVTPGARAAFRLPPRR